MKLFVENALVHRIFEEKFGGIANFADELAAADGFHGADMKSQRGVSTIYAWLKNGPPSKSDTVFRFFGALGVDGAVRANAPTGRN